MYFVVGCNVNMARYVKPANMRKVFQYPHKELTHFYPWHMERGMQGMQRRLKEIDCILEIHDARIPFSGRNTNFDVTLRARPHILLLNKSDVADMQHRDAVYNVYKQRHGVSNIMHITCTSDTHSLAKKLLAEVMETIENSDRYNRRFTSEYNLLVIGVPNVGKSSLINLLRNATLRKGKATPEGPTAGVTRSVLEKIKISEAPKIYVYDTPGILHPNIEDMEVAMNLALCAMLKDSTLGEEKIVDYMLFKLNSMETFRYVDYYRLPEPTDNVLELLAFIAKKNNHTLRKRNISGSGMVDYPDFNRTAKLVLTDFRSGKLGKVNLDWEKIQKIVQPVGDVGG